MYNKPLYLVSDWTFTTNPFTWSQVGPLQQTPLPGLRLDFTSDPFTWSHIGHLQQTPLPGLRSDIHNKPIYLVSDWTFPINPFTMSQTGHLQQIPLPRSDLYNKSLYLVKIGHLLQIPLDFVSQWPKTKEKATSCFWKYMH